MILSVVVFLVWLGDLVAAFTVDRFFGIGVIFYAPAVFLGIWAIIYFNLPGVKKQFRKMVQRKMVPGTEGAGKK